MSMLIEVDAIHYIYPPVSAVFVFSQHAIQSLWFNLIVIYGRACVVLCEHCNAFSAHLAVSLICPTWSLSTAADALGDYNNIALPSLSIVQLLWKYIYFRCSFVCASIERWTHTDSHISVRGCFSHRGPFPISSRATRFLYLLVIPTNCFVIENFLVPSPNEMKRSKEWVRWPSVRVLMIILMSGPTHSMSWNLFADKCVLVYSLKFWFYS